MKDFSGRFWLFYDVGLFLRYDAFCHFLIFFGEAKKTFCVTCRVSSLLKAILIIFEYFDKRYYFSDKRYFWNLDIFNILIYQIFLI